MVAAERSEAAVWGTREGLLQAVQDALLIAERAGTAHLTRSALCADALVGITRLEATDPSAKRTF